MPRPNHARLKYFTDREKQIAAFDRLWQPQAHQVVVFTGLSGKGKSTLIDWLAVNKCQPRQIPFVIIDLSAGLNPADFLVRLAELFKPDALARFQAAQTAITREFGRDIQALLAASAGRSVDIDASQTASGGGRLSQVSMDIQAGTGERERSDRRQLYRNQLTAAFRVEQGYLQQARAVIFLDTYERVQNSSAKTEIAWFWRILDGLLQQAPELRLVVGSRVDVSDETVREWRTREPLEPFATQDSERFLQEWSGGKMDSALRTAIYALAQGHPLLTRLAAEVWREGLRAGKPLTAAEMKAGLSHRSAEEWLYGRIINRFKERNDRTFA